MEKTTKRALAGVGATAVVVAVGAWLLLRPTVLESGPPPMAWERCHPEQLEVMVLGTFHFAQQDEIDILGPEAQREIGELLDGLERFGPDGVAVESPWAANPELNEAYATYLERPADGLASPNEIAQIGFRLARRLGLDRVWGVDVPIPMWHDSIAVFDERYPRARRRLRRKWSVRHPGIDSRPGTRGGVLERIRAWNADPPGNAEFGRFMPLVEGDVYAGALKLRAWYDRNLRTVQNLFRIAGGEDERILLVIGGSHVRVLRQILDLTPQLCAVDPLPYLPGPPAGRRRKDPAA